MISAVPTGMTLTVVYAIYVAGYGLLLTLKAMGDISPNIVITLDQFAWIEPFLPVQRGNVSVTNLQGREYSIGC